MSKRPATASPAPPPRTIQEVLAHAAKAVREDRAQDAVETLRQATRSPAPHPLAFLELGDLLGRLGRYDEAVAAFEAGLAREPDAIILRVGLGYVLLNRGDRAAARAQFEQVRALAPARYDATVAMADVMAAEGDYVAAIVLYRRALDMQPGNAITQISLGRCLLEIGDRDAAERALRTATAGEAARAWPAVVALAATPHGRAFLRPSAVSSFLGVKPS